jgi:ABC-type phosphate transport system substrate-binding protein
MKHAGLAVTALAAGLVLITSSRVPAAAEGYKVIVHPSNAITSLPRDQVARMFLKKTTNWPDGGPAVPVDLSDESSVRATFSKEVLKKTLSEIRSYWQQQVFSGRSVPPIEKTTDKEVIGFVEGNPKAIGYVSAGATGEFKVLKVIE